MYISSLMALFNAVPKIAQLLAIVALLSSYRGVKTREWSPNVVLRSSQRTLDWFYNYVNLYVSTTANDPNDANRPYGAVSRELLKSGGAVNKLTHSFSSFSMEQAISDDFCILPTLDVGWYKALYARIIYD